MRCGGLVWILRRTDGVETWAWDVWILGAYLVKRFSASLSTCYVVRL